jgi:hypothetical protein
MRWKPDPDTMYPVIGMVVPAGVIITVIVPAMKRVS